MADIQFDMQTVEKLLQKAKEHQVAKIKVKNEAFEIVVENAAAVPAAVEASSSLPQESHEPFKKEETPLLSGSVMRAPLIGTFYAAPSPESAPFAAVGQKVNKGDVLFIIESMKLMNEIQSEYSGTVKEILVQNGENVDYNQPIMVIE